jgi:hypothetical protein
MAEQNDELAGAEAQQKVDMRQRKHGLLSAAIAGVTLVAVVAIFALFALARSGAPAIGSSPQGRSAIQVTLDTASWRIYHDPLGLFTVRVPQGWKATGGINGNYTEGNLKSGLRASGQSEGVGISDPNQGSGSASLGIYAEQLTSDAGRKITCEWYAVGKTQATTINGYPAQVDEPGMVWMVETQTAHFQIGVTIPGVLVPDHTSSLITTPPPTPTTLPQSWVQQDRVTLADMLGCFQPTAKPLTCS